MDTFFFPAKLPYFYNYRPTISAKMIYQLQNIASLSQNMNERPRVSSQNSNDSFPNKAPKCNIPETISSSKKVFHDSCRRQVLTTSEGMKSERLSKLLHAEFVNNAANIVEARSTAHTHGWRNHAPRARSLSHSPRFE